MKPVLAAAIAEAGHMTEAMGALVRVGVSPDFGLATHAVLIGILQDCTYSLHAALLTESALAGAALERTVTSGTASFTGFPGQAASTRTALTRASLLSQEAAELVGPVRRKVTALAEPGQGEEPGRPAAVRRARDAGRHAAGLAEALTAARPAGGEGPVLGLVTGHRQVTEAIATATAHLAFWYRQQRDPLADTLSRRGPRHRNRSGRLADSLTYAGNHLARASRRTAAASQALTAVQPIYQMAAAAQARS